MSVVAFPLDQIIGRPSKPFPPKHCADIVILPLVSEDRAKEIIANARVNRARHYVWE
jgi:hypothetical protein